MRIEPLERDRAAEAAAQIYAELEQRHGRVSTFYKMLAYKPDLLRAFIELEGAVMAEGALPDRFKQLAYVRASLLNGCAR